MRKNINSEFNDYKALVSSSSVVSLFRVNTNLAHLIINLASVIDLGNENRILLED